MIQINQLIPSTKLDSNELNNIINTLKIMKNFNKEEIEMIMRKNKKVNELLE